jgi:hypothetical protein
MANILDKLEDECATPNFWTVQSWSRKQADSRAEAVKTIASTKNRPRGTTSCFAPLKSRASCWPTLRTSNHLKTLSSTRGYFDLKRATTSLKISMEAITKDCITRLEAQYGQVLQHVTPYDTEDAKRLLDKQSQLLDTLEAVRPTPR